MKNSEKHYYFEVFISQNKELYRTESMQWCKYFSTFSYLLTPDCQVLGSSYS